MDFLISSSPAVLSRWASEVLQAGLYRQDGLARDVFRGDGTIYLMAYLPGKAWAMYHSLPESFVRRPSVGKQRVIGSVFVHPDHRHQGIGRAIGNFVWEAWKQQGSSE